MVDLVVNAKDDYFVVSTRELGANYSFYLFRDGEIVERRMRQASASVIFLIAEPGYYKVKAFVEQFDGSKISAVTDSIFFSLLKDSEASDNSSGSIELSALTLWNRLGIDPDIVSMVEQVRMLTSIGIDPTALNTQLRMATATPTGWFNSDRVKGSADDVIDRGWAFRDFQPIQFDGKINWEVAHLSNRTWAYELHSWRFLDPVLKRHFEEGDKGSLDWILRVVRSWFAYAKEQTSDDMVWYDMSSSLRLARLIRILVVQSRRGCDEDFVFLSNLLVQHLEFAAKPDFFNSGNNHGFYAAAATMDAVKHVPVLAQQYGLKALGQERMGTMVAKQFASDGGHLEHSPNYHRMLLGSFESALRDGLITDERVAEKIKNAANVLGWMVQPNGELVQFGDSPATKMMGLGRTSSDLNTEYILSEGSSGVPSDSELKVLPESGYAFVRSPKKGDEDNFRESSYLAFLAGFHSSAHKHADDLTFVWSDKGHEILVDSGRFGYVDLLPAKHPDRDKGFFYSSSERQYVESTKAHNAIAIRDEDIERRNRKIPGSGLGKCTHADGRFILRGAFDYLLYEHQRMIRFDPGSSLEVIDTITTASPKTFVSWFNVASDFSIETDGRDLMLLSKQSDLKVRVTANAEDQDLVEPVFGERSPMRGWRSRRDGYMEEIWNFGFSYRVEGTRQNSVLFRIEE